MIAFEGGGSKGAFAAGAFHYLANNVPNLTYDAVSGVSAGAVNAALFTLYPPGEEIEIARRMVEEWGSMTNDSVKKHWSNRFDFVFELFRE